MAESVTYTPAPQITGKKLTCKRCGRVYAYPAPDTRPVRCECGWWYRNDRGRIKEEFRPRLEP